MRMKNILKLTACEKMHLHIRFVVLIFHKYIFVFFLNEPGRRAADYIKKRNNAQTGHHNKHNDATTGQNNRTTPLKLNSNNNRLE